MTEELMMLQTASSEIKYLRSRNGLMQARLDMFDQVMQVFNVRPPHAGDMCSGPDITFKIDAHIERSKIDGYSEGVESNKTFEKSSELKGK